jgi:hypothetical protein
VYLLSPAASFVNGTTLRIDAGRPQVRLGWPMRPADDKIRERAAIRPFEGFHRATAPKLFGEPKNSEGHRCPTPRSHREDLQMLAETAERFAKTEDRPSPRSAWEKAGELPREPAPPRRRTGPGWAWATRRHWAAPPPHGRCAMCWRPRWRAMVPAAA